MEFWKMNGAGNDFIILDNRVFGASPARLGRIAWRYAGGASLLGLTASWRWKREPRGATLRCGFYNSDGSLGRCAGNGARCICRYGYERGWPGMCSGWRPRQGWS